MGAPADTAGPPRAAIEASSPVFRSLLTAATLPSRPGRIETRLFHQTTTRRYSGDEHARAPDNADARRIPDCLVEREAVSGFLG